MTYPGVEVGHRFRTLCGNSKYLRMSEPEEAETSIKPVTRARNPTVDMSVPGMVWRRRLITDRAKILD